MQAPSEDLVNDAVTVVWIVGLLSIVISCEPQRAQSINTHTDNTDNLFSTSEGLSGPLSHFTIPLQRSLPATSQPSGFSVAKNRSKPLPQGLLGESACRCTAAGPIDILLLLLACCPPGTRHCQSPSVRFQRSKALCSLGRSKV